MRPDDAMNPMKRDPVAVMFGAIAPELRRISASAGCGQAKDAQDNARKKQPLSGLRWSDDLSWQARE